MEESLKTGTTTVGIVCKDAVVLAADKRATAGHLIAYKKAKKVHAIGDNMAITWAGSVSDIQMMTKLLSAELKLKNIRSGRTSTVKEAAHLLSGMVYSNIRQFFPGIAHFLFAGYESEPMLFDIFPDGSIEQMDDFVSSGSGSVFAYGVLEANFKKNMSEQEAVSLATNAVNSALQRDIASGNGIDVFVINKNGVKQVISKLVETKVN